MRHWRRVGRCRALENIAYVVASNQGASLAHYPADAIMTPYVGSHDTQRFLSLADPAAAGVVFNKWPSDGLPVVPPTTEAVEADPVRYDDAIDNAGGIVSADNGSIAFEDTDIEIEVREEERHALERLRTFLARGRAGEEQDLLRK